MNGKDNRYAGLPGSGDEGAQSEWGDLANRLRALTPPEPDASARERMWQRVERALPVPDPVVAALRAADPGEPDAAGLDRAWRRVSRGLPGTPVDSRQPVRKPRTAPAGLRWAALGAAVLLMFAAGALNAAAAALPGMPAYPLKQAYEAALWELAFTPEAHTAVALLLASERESEADRLVRAGADPALVIRTLDAGLADLAATGKTLPPREVAIRVRAWQSVAQQWPSAYRAPAIQALDTWIAVNPGGTSLPPLALPTQGVPLPQATLPATRPPATATVAGRPAVPTGLPVIPINPVPTIIPTRPAITTQLPIVPRVLTTVVPLPSLPGLPLTATLPLTQTPALPTLVFPLQPFPLLPSVTPTATLPTLVFPLRPFSLQPSVTPTPAPARP